MTKSTSKPLELMMTALNWSYDHASASIPGLGSAENLANSHLASCGGDAEKAIDHLVRWQMAYAFSAGFATNLGGIITMPIGVPANVVSVLFIQLRMIAAIAHIRGYKINDEQVRTLAFISLTGSGSAVILQDFGINVGLKLGAQAIKAIPGSVLIKINQAVGFRLITKAGTTGLINLTKLIPLAGGLVGGGFDAGMTKMISRAAKAIFKTIPGGSLNLNVQRPSGPLIEGELAMS
jgi:hypothetical protein